MAVRAEFVRQVVCREAPGEDEVGVRCRRHRGTISAVRRSNSPKLVLYLPPAANCRYAERGRRCTCTSVWRGGSCRHLRVPSRYVGFRVASNLFVKPSAEPDLFGLCRGEKRSTNVNVFVKPGAEPNVFGLCRGMKTKDEIQRKGRDFSVKTESSPISFVKMRNVCIFAISKPILSFGVACKEGWQECPEFRDIRDPGCSEG